MLRLRARLHLAAQEPAKAAALLERVVAAQPHDHASRYQLVQAYETLGRRQDAEAQRALWQKTQEALQKLTKVVNEAADRPWDAAPRRRAAELCQELNQPELAARWLKAAAACPPAPDVPPAGADAEPQTAKQ